MNSRLQAVLVALLVWAVTYLPALGSIAIKGEEGRRILPAIGMLKTGNYVVPEVGGNPYFRKPPLVNWLVAASFRIFGVRNEWTARLPSAVAVLAVAIAFVTVARANLGPRGSIVAALIWMTNIGMIEKGRLIEIEALYISLCGLAIIFWLSFWVQRKSPWLVWVVPIVEPEVLMDGTHTIERYFEVTQQTLESVFHALYEHRVSLEGMLLKPNMVLSGKECPQQASVQEVAEATVRCMKRVVPAAVPGLVFLSGGQTDQQATEHLNAMNQFGDLPWQLSFSYGRALQAPVLKAWKGDQANVAAAQEAFHHRAWCNSKARFGKYTEDMETAKAA
jgi:hypothetical protein